MAWDKEPKPGQTGRRESPHLLYKPGYCKPEDTYKKHREDKQKKLCFSIRAKMSELKNKSVM